MTATFRALDFAFSVAATDPALEAIVDHLYDGCRTSGPAETQYTLLERGTDATKIALYENDDRLLTTSDESLALAYLVWQVNQRAITASGARLLLHAAAAGRAGRAVLLPAPSGAGKSTLVAGLVAAGFDYLTDDLCAIDPDGNRAIPYPKPIAIATATLPALFAGSGAPATSTEGSRFGGEDTFLTATDLGGAVATDAVAPRFVVAPAYTAGAATQLEPLSRAETAVLLAEQSFNFDELGAPALFLVAELLRGCTCYRLTYADLPAGVACISDLLAA